MSGEEYDNEIDDLDEEDEQLDADEEEISEEIIPEDDAIFKPRSDRRKHDPLLRTSNKSQKTIIVDPEDRTTDHRLHDSEVAYIIAMRAQQIANTATHFATGCKFYDPVAIAYEELYSRRCPFILRREIGISPNGESIVENWNVREMTLPPIPPPSTLGSGRIH
ncbi:uncharacterized protein LOC136088441 [Hydra vulgaris]|uniref:Uncharacterized protein LOC136088441 n=1 Tax=Hydra vulgaris TaxID=6087 RepID=A0ABM4D1U3_HYDVU